MNPILFWAIVALYTLFFLAACYATFIVIRIAFLWLGEMIKDATCKDPDRESFAAWAILLVFALAVFSPLFIFETVGSKKFVLNGDGSIGRVFEEPAIIFQKTYNALVENGGTLVSYGGGTEWASAHTSPVTANPKVRRLVCWIKIQEEEWPESALKRRASLETFAKDRNGRRYDLALSRYATYQLYEFTEKQSGALAEFYNPLDGTQQAKFLELAHAFFDPRFETDGMRLLDARFDVE